MTADQGSEGKAKNSRSVVGRAVGPGREGGYGGSKREVEHLCGSIGHGM